MSKVAIKRCQSYNQDQLDAAVSQCVELLGGIDRFVRKNDKVLLKPNLVLGHPPAKAVTTQPEIVASVVKLVRRAGGVPVVGDSPGGVNSPKRFNKILDVTGVGKICEELQVPVVLFDEESIELAILEGKLYKKMRVAKELKEADVVISLPRLKAHPLMTITGSVKVLFGFVLGPDKAWCHLKVPERDDFADMLLDLYLGIKPALSIMDAVVAMEGNGPSAGEPRNLGVVLASCDSIALDVVASKIIGLNPLRVDTNRRAVERRLIPKETEEIEILGESLASISVDNFKLPVAGRGIKVPQFLKDYVKDIVIAKPTLTQKSRCVGCGICRDNCPAKAIVLREGYPSFNYDKCIRCYCCSELCPEQALGLSLHPLARMFLR